MNEKRVSKEGNPSDPSKKPQKRRRWLFWTGGILILIIVLLIVGILSAPSILSSNFGRNRLVKTVNEGISGTIQLDDINLRWFGGQSLEGLQVIDPQGKSVLTLGKFTTDASLWGLVRGRYALGKTEISGLKADIATDEAGNSNLQRAFAPKISGPISAATATAPPVAKAPPKAGVPVQAPKTLTGEIVLKDSEVTFTAPGKEPVKFANLQGELRVPDISQPLILNLSTRTEQGRLSGGLATKGNVVNLFASDGTLTLDKASGDLVASATDLPVDGIDQMLGMKGTLSAALGSPLNLNAQGRFAQDSTNVSVLSNTPNLKADLTADMSGGKLTLAKPAEISLNITPALVQHLAAQQDPKSSLRLASAVPARLTLQELNAPLSGFDPAAISAKASLTLGDARFTGDPTLGDVSIRNLTTMVNVPNLAESINVQVQGITEKEGQSGEIRVDADIKQLFAADGRTQMDKMQANIKANVDGLPIGPVDQILGQKGLLVAALGPRLNLKANALTSGEETRADVDLRADRITAQIPVTIGKTLSLQSPAQINYTLTPALAKRVLGATGPQLRNEVPVQIIISKLTAPVAKAGEPSFVPDKTVIQTKVTAGEMRVVEPSLGLLTLRNLAVEMSGDSLAKTLVTLAAQVASSSPAFIAAIGPVAETTLRASGGFKANGTADFPDIQLNIKSNNLNGDLSGKLTERFTLAKPASFNLTLTPETLREFKMVQEGQPNLSGPTAMTMTIDELDVPVSKPDYSTLKMAAKARIPSLALTGDARYKGVSLNDAALDINASGASNKASLKLNWTTKMEGESKAGRIQVDAELNNIIQGGQLAFASASTKANANIENLPVALLETFSGQGGKLTPMIGPAMNVNLTADIPPGGQTGGKIDLKAQGERMNLDAGASLGDVLTLTRPGTLKLTLTPEAFNQWMAPKPGTETPAGSDAGGADYTLQDTAEINGSVKSLRWPMVQKNKGQSFDPANTGIDAVITIPRLALLDRKTNRATTINQLQASVAGENLAKPVGVNVTGKVAVAAAEGKPSQSGDIQLKGELTDLFKENGEFNSEGFGASLRGILSGLPVPPLDAAVGAQQQLVAVLGDVLGATGNIELARNKGPITADLKSSNSQIYFAGNLADNQLTLREPVKASVGVNPLLSKLILKNINPLLVNAIGGDPIRLQVENEGFAVPLDSKKLNEIQVKSAKLELGTLVLDNGGVLNGLLTLLKQSSAKQMSARFTPLVARVTNGVAEYDRMDIFLAESFHLATWGKVDLPKDQVDMILGITAETLDDAFGIEGLPEDQMLQIPMRGPTSNVQVDWGKAALQVAQMMAGKKLSDKIPGGGLIGNILGGGKTAPPPPPGSESSKTEQPKPEEKATPAGPGGILENILGGPKETPKPSTEPTAKPPTREKPDVGGVIEGILGGGSRRGTTEPEPAPKVESAPTPVPAATATPVKAAENTPAPTKTPKEDDVEGAVKDVIGNIFGK